MLDVGDLATQQARSTTYQQQMDVEEFDLRYSIKSEKSSLDFGANYRGTKIDVYAAQTGQDLGSWGIANPGDIEQIVPGAMEAFCMSCRFDDFPVGQANIAFRGDAAQMFYPLTTSAAVRGPGGFKPGEPERRSKKTSWRSMRSSACRANCWDAMSASPAVCATRRQRSIRRPRRRCRTRIRWLADNDFTIDFSAGSTAVTGSGSYNHILPNIDIKMDVTDKVVARISYSETIGRVPYGSLFAATTAQSPNNPTALGGLTSGSSQDPSLLPLAVAELRRVGRVVLRRRQLRVRGLLRQDREELPRQLRGQSSVVRTARSVVGRCGNSFGRCTRPSSRTTPVPTSRLPTCSRWLR